MTTKFTSIDEYIAGHSPDIQDVLQRIRSTIKEAVPEAVETIAYNMPTFAVDKKSIVHFAAWKTHIGMYPIPPGDMEFAAAIDPYRTEKGTARFPYATPLPYPLIADLARFQVAAVLGR